MAKRWLVGLVAAIAVVCMAGVGFSAFTAQATVYGNASAAQIGLAIESTASEGCFYFNQSVPAPGSLSFSGLNAAMTSVSMNVANLTPDQLCLASLTLENVGTQPLNVTITLNTPGVDGICTAFAYNCFDVLTLSGIDASGWFYFSSSPTGDTPTSVSSNFTELNPGQSFVDTYAVDIPAGSGDSTPSTGSFTLVYSATVGFNTA
jgi:hypothetical protein